MVMMSADESRLTRTFAYARAHGVKLAAELAFNFVLPFAIYSAASGRFGAAPALMAASAPPILWSVATFIRERKIDAISMLVLTGIALSLIAFTGGAGVKFLDTVDGQNIQDVALTAAENLMTANPDMTALYATGEPALVGAISAVTSQKMTDKVKVFGWDLTAQAIKGIDDGWIVAVVQQDPYQEGVAGVDTIVKLKKGEKVDPSIDIPVTIVTKDNVDKYRSMFK